MESQALEISRASRHQPKYASIYQSTKGIIFLGTPHRGSEMASWGLLASNLAKFALRGRNKDLLRGLTPHNELLENLNKSFRQILEDGGLHVHCFYEARAMTGLYGLQDLVWITICTKKDRGKLTAACRSFLGILRLLTMKDTRQHRRLTQTIPRSVNFLATLMPGTGRSWVC